MAELRPQPESQEPKPASPCGFRWCPPCPPGDPCDRMYAHTHGCACGRPYRARSWLLAALTVVPSLANLRQGRRRAPTRT